MANDFADILKISKKGLSGRVANKLTTVSGRIPTALSTGSLYLDFMLNGGILRGRMHQFYGPSGAGKSTLSYRAIAANQKVDLDLQKVGMGSLPNFLPKGDYQRITSRPVVICDAEGSTNESFLVGCGIDIEDPLFSIFEPEFGEDWFHFWKRLNFAWYKKFNDGKSEVLNPDYVPAISLTDSLATLIPKSVLEDEQNQIASLARLLSQNMPIQLATDMKCLSTSLVINQVRINPMCMFGNPEVLKGGATPFHSASGNFRVTRTGDNEDVLDAFAEDGSITQRRYILKVSPKKCRWAPRTGDTFELYTAMGTGYVRTSDMWNYAKATKQLIQNGAWYQLKIIGRSDLDITKNVREADIKKYFVEKNLWEVFVKQLFSGAAWPTTLDPFQLELLGAIRTDDQPDLDLAQEQEFQELVDQQAAKVTSESLKPLDPAAMDDPLKA